MDLQNLVKKLQQALNEKGQSLDVDGEPGPQTKNALKNFDAQVSLVRTVPVIPVTSDEYFHAPWIGSNIDLLGLNERDPVLNKRLVPEWAKEGLDYKTLSGNDHAWCSVLVNADFRKLKIKGTDNAGAVSWKKYGRECPFWFGAVLPIEHQSGGRHVNRFLYWIDKDARLCATLDGNRGDTFCVAKTNLARGGDILDSSPRWPIGWQDGLSPTMAEVLRAYPFLKVGGQGSSTR